MSARLTWPECDVIIFGGGPAGAAAAITLALAGRFVVIIEKSRYEQARVGETLPPAARPLLVRLEVWDRFLAAKHLPSPGILSAWGEQNLYQTHFILNPYGQGWHLDRQRFDMMLVQGAADHGARLFCNAQVASCVLLAGDHWQVGFTSGVASNRRYHQLRAKFLIDATGRAAVLARWQGSKRLSTDRMVGLASVLATRSRESDCPENECDCRTLVEACADGWWYSALLPARRLMVVYMTDADLLRRDGATWRAVWQARLQQTIHTQLRLRKFDLHVVPRVVAANSSRLDCAGGRGWLAVGDAAMAFDPLSSQGLMQALASGICAGEALNGGLAGEAAAIGEYDVKTTNVFREYLRLRAIHYGREQRWPQSVFWHRRHVVAA